MIGGALAPDNYSTLIVNGIGSVTVVTLNRPHVRNAFDETLIAELTDAALQATESGSRALLIRGAGPAFCAGADLNWMKRAAEYTHDQNLEDARALQRMFAAIAHFSGVSIAVAHGSAIGGGAGLVAVCDIAIADETSVFALSEVRLGLVPAVISPYVIEKIGVGAARSLFVTGERFDGAKALRIGLVQHLVTGEAERISLEREILARVLEAGPAAVATAKQLIREVAGKDPDEVADRTATCIADLRASDEGREGVRAFLAKTKPRFAVPDIDPETP